MTENAYIVHFLSPPAEPSDKMFDKIESKTESRRGRPKAAMISNLIIEGATSQSGIRCEVCSRVFPRDKSLQAHRRVHTGERPYPCDFPGCLRKFKQSGQLKTHQRLHTGERPFLCSENGCASRFTHANRHCPTHPTASLIRSDDFHLIDPNESHHSEDVRQWLIKYWQERREVKAEKKDSGSTHLASVSSPFSNENPNLGEDNSPLPSPANHSLRLAPTMELTDMTNLTGERPPRHYCQSNLVPTLAQNNHTSDAASPEWTSLELGGENHDPLPTTPVKSPVKTPRLCQVDRAKPVKNLFSIEPNSVIRNMSPRKRELPKKRWLRIASREQAEVSPSFAANLNRPTVLRHAPCLTPQTPPQTDSTPFRSRPGSPPAVDHLHQLSTFLTPPYSEEKKRRSLPRPDEEEQLAVPLAHLPQEGASVTTEFFRYL